MALILAGASIYLIAYLMGNIDDTIRLPQPDIFHEYSGIHPELYMEYLSNKKAGNERAALDNIEELALYADIDIMDEIHEKILKQKSLFI